MKSITFFEVAGRLTIAPLCFVFMIRNFGMDWISWVSTIALVVWIILPFAKESKGVQK